jgi:hypothetical protein
VKKERVQDLSYTIQNMLEMFHEPITNVSSFNGPLPETFFLPLQPDSSIEWVKAKKKK